MVERRGEKLGWTLGLLGGSLWMIPASTLLLWSGRITFGLGGLCLFALTVASCVYLAPWEDRELPVAFIPPPQRR
jgi:hypothetical protein